MHWKLKHLGVSLLLIVFFSTWLPHPLLADGPAVSLEQAIQTAKKHFSIPAAYSDFHSEYVNTPQEESWMLQWKALEPATGNLEVTIDAASGECISMNHWRPEPTGGTSIPAMSEAEARKIAEHQLLSLLPQKASLLRPVQEQNLISLNDYGQRNYYFKWERYENGIPVLGNGVRIEIDCQNRDIRSYNLNWLDLPLPASTQAIAKEQALKVFQDEKMLSLEYYAPREVKTLVSKNKAEPRLVYLINHPSNGTINAITGKPLILLNGQWEDADEIYANARKMAAGGMGAADSASSLSPEEIKELEKNSRIISRDEAVAQVKKWVDIPAAAVLSNVSLGRDWQDQERRLWNLNWTVPQSKAGAKDYNLWARVDAFSGRIYAFNQFKPLESEKSNLNKDGAMAIASQFIKQIEPQLAEQVKLNDDTGSNPVEPLRDDNPSQWSFNYSRLVDDVIFPQDGFTITVSSQEQNVTGYDLNWSNYDFPPAGQAISRTEGNQAFLQAAPLTLCYSIIYQEASKPDLALVYKPVSKTQQEDFSMIDAVSRELLDATGRPLADKAGPHGFNDIKGHFAEKEISLIGKAGLMTEYNQQFHPDESINTITFLRALMGAREGIWSIDQVDDARLISLCQQRGWITEDADAKAPLTRDCMARVLVRSMGLERVAHNHTIFVNPYPDDPSINDSNLGYAALVKGMGLMPPSPAFNSDQKVTRGEVAYALVNSMRS